MCPHFNKPDFDLIELHYLHLEQFNFVFQSCGLGFGKIRLLLIRTLPRDGKQNDRRFRDQHRQNLAR
ncbi:hypothetical protein CSQ89_16335 [Chitinimonas sp. BJB300]|nr:hypothetical protein CSQ89_16335 [Chitinimonas sp. BJB300]